MIPFRDAHYPKEVIIDAVIFCVCDAVSYRELEEIIVEHGFACQKQRALSAMQEKFATNPCRAPISA